MRRFILIIITVLISSTIQAQTPSGVSIESRGATFIVLLDGKQISSPTQSCFIANLEKGDHLIEAYSLDGSRRRVLLLSQRIRYKGSFIRLEIDENQMQPPGHVLIPGRPVYNPDQFALFLKTIKNKSFDSGRIDVIETVRGTVWFTSEQVAQLSKTFDFDSGQLKMLEIVIPYTVDLQNSYIIAETLDFDSSKRKLQKLVQKETSH